MYMPMPTYTIKISESQRKQLLQHLTNHPIYIKRHTSLIDMLESLPADKAAGYAVSDFTS